MKKFLIVLLLIPLVLVSCNNKPYTSNPEYIELHEYDGYIGLQIMTESSVEYYDGPVPLSGSWVALGVRADTSLNTFVLYDNGKFIWLTNVDPTKGEYGFWNHEGYFWVPTKVGTHTLRLEAYFGPDPDLVYFIEVEFLVVEHPAVEEGADGPPPLAPTYTPTLIHTDTATPLIDSYPPPPTHTATPGGKKPPHSPTERIAPPTPTPKSKRATPTPGRSSP